MCSVAVGVSVCEWVGAHVWRLISLEAFSSFHLSTWQNWERAHQAQGPGGGGAEVWGL